ncbi:hypothetical protein GCM10011490_24240 [Pseudoclavibacter endophyticus]|uniref:Uncharacterized protein n=1 Tax=Pseudoclavibacter endophyticus TaxID=1778590 RepID=A0A6H9WQW0_9MICO|nr:hypothetical protein [Pseudoclavibacter endophyticus]KAB1648425.1 hypothetical protein F8O04_12125 [Pseudoclavibacter endophyticus]GGA72616.1 hypothetical protein GCM10011490_24240 [Pseudoclavibacter endophyticus]
MGINTGRPERGIRGSDRYLILAVPATAIEDPSAITVTELEAETAIDVTYSFTSDGYNRSPSEETVNDDRLTLGQSLTERGRRTDTLQTTIVASGEESVADNAFIEDEEFYHVHRPYVPHDEPLAAGQEYDAIPVRVGMKVRNIPVGNAMQTKTITWHHFDQPIEGKALVA